MLSPYSCETRKYVKFDSLEDILKSGFNRDKDLFSLKCP
jgi:hypothetical protein